MGESNALLAVGMSTESTDGRKIRIDRTDRTYHPIQLK